MVSLKNEIIILIKVTCLKLFVENESTLSENSHKNP